MALRQDWALVRMVLDYRNATAARELLKDRKQGTKVLSENPALVDLLLEMRRAQGQTTTRETLLARPDADEDEDT